MWNAHNTVFGLKRSAICAEAVYFLHSTLLSVTCLRLCDVSVICRVTYFQFPIQSAFLPCRSTKQHSGVPVYAILDIGRKLWSVSCTERTLQGNEFEFILTVDMETFVEGSFGSEFPAIYSHCVVMAA